MKELMPLAEQVGGLLKERRETIAIAESSTGGLISAALLAVPGASAYFLGGAVVYTRQSRVALLDIPDAALVGMRPSTEAYAQLLAKHARQRFATTWALSETGATGPTGNRYGDAAGHSCIAIAGPADVAMTLETGSPERLANMYAFTDAALNLLLKSISK
jgi:nicotinamide-nucleotide amidase